MIENNRSQKTEFSKADSTATWETGETHQEGGGRHLESKPMELAADQRADPSTRATPTTDALLKGDDRRTDDLDRTRATPDQMERSDRQGDTAGQFQAAEELLQREHTQCNDRWKHDGYAEKKVKDFSPLPEDGSKSWFHRDGCAWLSREGTVTVETKLGEPSDRRNFEGFLPTSTDLGLKHYHDRAHAQGAGTGIEAPYGIALALREVNQELQNHGVEAFIRELQAHKRDDVDLYLRTEVNTNGLHLENINYVLEAAKKSEGFVENRQERATLLTASIEVTGPRDNPRAKFDVDDCSHYYDRISTILKSSPDTEEHRRNHI